MQFDAFNQTVIYHYGPPLLLIVAIYALGLGTLIATRIIATGRDMVSWSARMPLLVPLAIAMVTTAWYAAGALLAAPTGPERTYFGAMALWYGAASALLVCGLIVLEKVVEFGALGRR